MLGKHPYLNISGIKNEDIFTKEIIDNDITNAVRKWSKFSSIDEIRINVEKHDVEGKRKKYSVKAELSSNQGILHAEHSSWKLPLSVKKVLDKLERELIKQKEKGSTRPRAP